jgi:integrase
LIDELKKQKATHTCILPKMAAKEWHFFFKEVGLPHLSFHSTRVTVVTKMARAGINQQQAMRYVGHASETVHRVYQRLTALDVAGVTQAVQYAKRETPGIPDDPQSTSPAGASS